MHRFLSEMQDYLTSHNSDPPPSHNSACACGVQTFNSQNCETQTQF